MSGTGSFQGVQWVPGISDLIVNWSTDLKLYKISVVPREYKPEEVVSEYIVNCPALKSELRCRITDVPHYTKCMAVSPIPTLTSSTPASSPTRFGTSESPNFNSSDIKVAVGQANGRISLLSGAGIPTLKEFGPKYGRACNDLAWNPKITNYLAAAYEKNRSDNCIMIFDTSMSPPSQSESTSTMSKMVNKSSKDLIKPICELGMGETCNSLAWFHKNPDTLVAGMNLKNLRIYDLRISSRTGSGPKNTKTNVSRYINGLCVDPHMDYRVASYYDNTVVIWDTRNFDKPIWTRSQNNEVVHLAWSPTRSGLLCSLVKNSIDTLMLHDIQSWAVMSEDGEPAVTQRVVSVLPLEYPDPTISIDPDLDIEGKNIISSFAWHPKEENCLVACRKDGRLAEVHVMERIAPSWSSQHFLVWPHNGTLRSHDRSQQFYSDTQDISLEMQERAKLNCYKADKPHVDDSLSYHIKIPFAWLCECRTLMEDLAFKNQFPKNMTLPGIRTAIGLDRGKSFVLKSDITYKHWNLGTTSLSDPKAQRPKRIFKGDPRHRALKLCGWGVDENELKIFTQKLERGGQHARAAALAVFNLEIRLALQILERAQQSEELLHVVAMALSGFSEEKVGALWREMVGNLVEKLKNPYLRTMFQFLLITTHWTGSDQETFGLILEEEGLMPTDRVAFACLYLPDEKLSDYINQKWKKAKLHGDISSIYLTGGSSSETIELLQQYVDVTGDVQTASWICVTFMPGELVQASEAANSWMSSYRSLLSTWNMYKERALFDLACYTSQAIKQVTQQVYVSCNFCGKAISRYTNGLPESALGTPDLEKRKINATLNLNALQRHTTRFQSCPACKKPTPRCSICLVNMGSHSGYLTGMPSMLPDPSKKRLGIKVTPFSNFFVWCQVCRHGGHAEHIEEWFDEYSECPVSGCHCKCNSHDMDTSNTDSSSNKKKLIEDSSTEIEFSNDQQL